MAPTEGRVAKPERRWSCRRGTPTPSTFSTKNSASLSVFVGVDVSWGWHRPLSRGKTDENGHQN